MDDKTMRLTNLNPVNDIGANSTLAEIGPFNILIDAGMNPKLEGRRSLPDFSLIESKHIDLIVVTHCHLDHLGGLPVASRYNPDSPILTSIPSAMIAPRMLINSVNVMKRIREESGINEYPLYTASEVARIEEKLFPMPFNKPRTLEKNGEELTVTLYPSGHIPGAAGVLIEYKHRKIFFTGDVLFENMRILQGAEFPKCHLDTLVMETTRGSTKRALESNRKSEVDRLLQTISRTLQHGGSVLIPTFALGRMQEVLAILNDAMNDGRLDPTPVYSSGLGVAIVDVFDIISRKTGLVNFRKKIMHDMKVKVLKKPLDPGVSPKEPGIYVLSSGMMVEHTPSYFAAASMISNPHNTFCFIGYCDPDTPGGALLSKAHDEPFSFDKLNYVSPIRAQIERFDLSGHADREELRDFAINASPRAIVLTHGDSESKDWFISEFYENPITAEARIIDPQPRETLDI